jgi:hypothetical protein
MHLDRGQAGAHAVGAVRVHPVVRAPLRVQPAGPGPVIGFGARPYIPAAIP